MISKVTKHSLTILCKALYKSINLLFPRRFTRTTYGIPFQQLNTVHSYATVLYWLHYQEGETKRLIWRFKYFLDNEPLRVCTYILYDQLVADASDRVHKIPFRTPYLLLHYPSSTYFKGKKQFDHMKELTLLLDSLQDSQKPFFLCCTHAILPNQNKADELESQHTGSRKQRFVWSKKRFVLSPQFEDFIQRRLKTTYAFDYESTKTHPSHLYCIDDIVTTGASMNAVTEILQKKYNVHVSKFCICH